MFHDTGSGDVSSAQCGGSSAEKHDPHRDASLAWCHFPSDRRYHANHGWVRELSGGRMRCGVDAFAVRLLGPASSVVLPSVGGQVRRDEVACWLRTGGGRRLRSDSVIAIRGSLPHRR